MIPKRVQMRNFMSFVDVEILFDDDEPIWVIGGPNGVGKSAVFDAITYCLYGVHRGGALHIDQLIRHGSDGFQLVLDFEFNRKNYRIARTRRIRSSQSLECETAPDQWERVPNVQTANDITKWVCTNIGIDFKAFQASVLLRQGNADVLVDAQPAERLGILKSIIGLEQYESFSKHVHQASAKVDQELMALKYQRDGLRVVIADEVQAAQQAFTEAEQTLNTAVAHEATIAATVAANMTYRDLSKKAQALQFKLDEANELEFNAQPLRFRYSRWVDLDRVVPVLRRMQDVRQRLAQHEIEWSQLNQVYEKAHTEAGRLQEELDDCEDQLRQARECHAFQDTSVKVWQEEITLYHQHLKVVAELGQTQRLLNEYPASLVQDYESANEVHRQAEIALRVAQDHQTVMNANLKHAELYRQKCADIQSGVNCSSCGQPVTEAHAELERRAAYQAWTICDEQYRQAAETVTRLMIDTQQKRSAAERLGESLENRNRYEQHCLYQQNILRGLNISDDENVIREMVTSLQTLMGEAEAERVKQEKEVRRLQPRCAELCQVYQAALRHSDDAQLRHRDAQNRSQMVQGEWQATSAQIDTQWHDTTDDTIAEMVCELDQLMADQVPGEHRRLEHALVTRAEWQSQLASLRTEMEWIPLAARQEKHVVEKEHADAIAVREEASDKRQSARDELARTREDERRYRELADKLAEVERSSRWHQRLDMLFGKTGLQRQLVRQAERRIVAIAQETVQELSDGDLSLELDCSDETDDSALSLIVRRGERREPIPMAFLSGSQKFRVAISIALAIGQYASSQARPLESVIIDEGFGSLDKDGLRAAAEELNRLKSHLRRIILVSHQDDFTDHFPVMIRLSPTDEGTIATKIRRG